MAQISFQNLINSIDKFAKRDRWVAVYDKLTDYFYWKKPKLSTNTCLLRISNETSVYLNLESKKTEGVMVEYLTNNFMEHNEGFEKFDELFTKKIDDTLYGIPENNKKADEYLDKLPQALRADAYQDSIENGLSKNDLNDLVLSATK